MTYSFSVQEKPSVEKKQFKQKMLLDSIDKKSKEKSFR